MLLTGFLQENKEQATRSFRIVIGHVVMLKRYLETLGQWSQTMAFVLWIKIAGEFQRVNDRLGNRWHTVTLIVRIHKTNVKGGIVSNENGILAEILEHLQDLFNWFSIADMIIRNPCQLSCKGR